METAADEHRGRAATGL